MAGEVYNIGGGRKNSCSIPYTYEEAQEVFMDECLPRYLSELGIVNHVKWCWRAKRY